jgi:hypothetical protein
LIRYIGDARVRVSLARPRTRAGGRRNFDPNMYVDLQEKRWIRWIVFYFKGVVINVVLEVILVEIVGMINEVIKKMAMDISKFWIERYVGFME